MDPAIRIPDERRYYHFITEWVSAVHRYAGMHGRPTIFYDGPYQSLLIPFARGSISQTDRTITCETLGKGRFDQQLEIASIIKRSLLTEGKIPQSGTVVTIIKRRHNRRWVDSKSLIKAIERLLPKVEVLDLYLEDQPLPEQIALMVRTRILIGAHGAGLVNAMFMPAGGSVIEVNPHGFLLNIYPKLSSRSSLNHICMEADASPERSFETLPRPIAEMFRGREFDAKLFVEINNQLTWHPQLNHNGPLFRAAVRDVSMVPVDCSKVAEMCERLWQVSS